MKHYHWKRCPSVTRGGKPFFWTRRTSTGRQWIVWHRRTRRWILEDEACHILGVADTPDELFANSSSSSSKNI